jgi:hypothetical protein
MTREGRFDLARKLDWDVSYVPEEEIVPPDGSGRRWLRTKDWAGLG